MVFRQLFGWLTTHRLESQPPIALPPASEPAEPSAAPAAPEPLPAPAPAEHVTTVIDITDAIRPPAASADATQPVVLPAAPEPVTLPPAPPTTAVVLAGSAAAPDVAAAAEPAALSPQPSGAIVTTDAVLVDDAAGTDWRGAGYFSRGGYPAHPGAEPRFKPPIEMVRLELERFRRARPVALPPPAQPVPRPLAATTTVPLDFLPVLTSEPEHRRQFLPAIDPALFTAFFFDRERPGTPTDVYVRWPPILQAADLLLGSLVDNQYARPPRLSIDALFAAALQQVADPPSALLVCHNVTKAVARGSPALGIHRIDPDRPVWEFRGSRLEVPQGRLFFRLFDPQALTSADAGAWYRFFGVAAATAFAAGRLLVRSPVTPTAAIVGQVDAIGRAMLVGEAGGAAAAAQAWANALAWCEWTMFGRTGAIATTEITRASRAFCFGLRAIGAVAPGSVRWRVPAAAVDASDAPEQRAGVAAQAIDLPPC